MKKNKYLFWLLLIISVAIITILISFNKASNENRHFIPEYIFDPAADMDDIIIFENRVYNYTRGYQVDNDGIKEFLGDYIGRVTPTIDEYTKTDNMEIYFGATIFGQIYQVNGYADNFRICDYDTANKTINFYENLTGFSLESGSDIFTDRLHFDSQFTWDAKDIYCYSAQSSDDPSNIPGLTGDDILALYDSLNNSYHILYTDISQNLERICTLVLHMSDMTIVEIDCYSDNYIAYESVYFKMDDPIYDKITGK